MPSLQSLRESGRPADERASRDRQSTGELDRDGRQLSSSGNGMPITATRGEMTAAMQELRTSLSEKAVSIIRREELPISQPIPAKARGKSEE